jgi:ribosomal protein S27AE
MITCIIRYQLDPYKLTEFEAYARRWGQTIPRCGAELIGYFAPYEGTTSTAYGTSKALLHMRLTGPGLRLIRSVGKTMLSVATSNSFGARTGSFSASHRPRMAIGSCHDRGHIRSMARRE